LLSDLRNGNDQRTKLTNADKPAPAPVQLHVFNPKLIDRVRNDPIHSLHADESDPNPLERYS